MIYYKDNQNNVFAYSDIQTPKDGLTKITEQEALELTNPTPPPPVAPEQVSRAQGKAALITAGLWPDVLAYVDAMTDPMEKALAEVALNDTTHWRRDSPLLNDAADALEVSQEKMDDLFIQASQINL